MKKITVGYVQFDVSALKDTEIAQLVILLSRAHRLETHAAKIGETWKETLYWSDDNFVSLRVTDDTPHHSQAAARAYLDVLAAAHAAADNTPAESAA